MTPTATELVAGYRNKTISPVEVTEAALNAIDTLDGVVNAFVLVAAEDAIAAARASEARWQAGEPLGPADGVPTSIKDALWTRGWPTVRGSHLIDATGPGWDEDAPAVARLRESGAVLLGKTTTPEYSWKGVTDSPRYGVTANPWDPTKTAGGSSGGSAVAVALGMGAWSIGTDGGGSVRIPAAFTGTVALKPTYGLIPHYPPSPFGTLAHVGPMTRTVRDTAALLDVLTGFDARDWSAMPTPAASFLAGLDDGISGLRVAFSPNLGFVRNCAEVDSAVRAAVDVLVDAGAHVDEVDPGFGNPVQAFHVLWFAGAAKVLQAHGSLDAWTGRIDPGLHRVATLGATYTVADYLDAMAVRTELGRLMGEFHQTYDVLVTPTLPLGAFPAGQDVPDGSASPDWTSWTPYTYPFNLTQQPALSVPCGFTAAGLPIGLQIVGARHADPLVLRVGQAYQSGTDWHLRTPRLSTDEDGEH
ncbi:Glutamyl-tRNA(Gln) amidotransferase subunit A [Mycobacterium basiliense]|uniref:amidase n=1 Tax=Mycobacterium basiliense TaxID=2094119 RepID=A0A447GAT9_9MYCO|nr:amidase [Mycobacterium basiliense]VDM87583.1 Glutamyl-tRNA(Gln) amidotransferase subunit A [Mycobacterium basiliense]